AQGALGARSRSAERRAPRVLADGKKSAAALLPTVGSALRVAFAGTPQFALPALEALLEFHRVVGVLTQPDRPSGRGRHLSASPVKTLAEANHLPPLH